MPESTVFSLLRRFHERGCKFEIAKRGCKKAEIPDHVKQFLLDPQVLQEWCALPLWRRVGQLFDRFDFKISVTSLRRFYLLHKVKYRAASSIYRKAMTNHQEIHAKRIAFARLIGNFIVNGYPIIWVDETSFHAWSTASKSWCAKGQRNLHQSNDVCHRVTIYGGIGDCLEHPIYLPGRSTEQQ